MNNKTSSSKSTNLNETLRNTKVASKLRRLKIEENLLLQSIKKFDQKRNYEVSESDKTNDFDCKNEIKKLKDSYITIKNLFDDIKIITNSQELLAELDIDEIKKKVLELETTMTSFILHINTQLNSLKSTEQELTKQLEEMNFKDANMKKRPKISSGSFKQAVPSPVRLMMSSPLKCMEVQEFQDFMKNSPNRYGGWNEYHHNIFVQLWQKYFGNVTDIGYNDSHIEKLALDNFTEESLLKLQGIDKKNLMLHMEWYKQYMFYKAKQQAAIDKWKSMRIRSMKKVPDDNHVPCAVKNEIETCRQMKYIARKNKFKLTKPNQKILTKEDIERVMAPTKQWLSRCEYEQRGEEINCIENLEKLRKPTWRRNL